MLDLSNGNILIKFFFFKLRFKIYLDEKKWFFKIYLDEKKSGIFTS